MKKVLAIMGSPMKNRNSDKLLDEFLRGLTENNDDVVVNKVYLKDLDIGLCIGCSYCEKHGTCFQKDDMTDLYDEFNDSDGVIIASPMHFGSVSSLTKIMTDRCQIYWSSKYVLNKSSIDRDKKRHGALLITAGGPNFKDKFIGCTAPNQILFDSINTKVVSNVFVTSTDGTPTDKNTEAMEKAYEEGKNFFKDF